jgi:hypothetical protein
MRDEHNPFSVGDSAVFTPDRRTVGWYQHAFERWAVYPGYMGTVTRVESDEVELDGKSECAMHWSQFRSSAEISQSERQQLVDEYRRRLK